MRLTSVFLVRSRHRRVVGTHFTISETLLNAIQAAPIEKMAASEAQDFF